MSFGVAGGLLPTIGGMLAENTIGAALQGFVGETINAGASLVKYEIAEVTGISKAWVDEFLDNLTNSPRIEAHSLSGVSPAGLSNAMRDAIQATLRFSLILSENTAEELFMELIQEGFSNAIQQTIGGALQTIAATYRGAYPFNPNEVAEIAQIGNLLDRKTLAFALASAGASLPSTIIRVLEGYYQKVQTDLQQMQQQATDLELEAFNRTTNFQRIVANFADEGLLRAISLPVTQAETMSSVLSEQSERALARLFELAVEITTAEEEQTLGLVSQAEVDTIKAQNLAEILALETQYDTLRNEFDAQIVLTDDVDWNTWRTAWMQGVNLLVAQLNIAKIQIGNVDTTTGLQPLLDAYDDILAYRGASTGIAGNDLDDPFGIGVTEPPEQPPTGTADYQMKVVVKDFTGATPLVNALVQITGAGVNESYLTDGNGEVFVGNLTDQLYTVRVSKAGYVTAENNVANVEQDPAFATHTFFLGTTTGGGTLQVSEMDITIDSSISNPLQFVMESEILTGSQDTQLPHTQGLEVAHT